MPKSPCRFYKLKFTDTIPKHGTTADYFITNCTTYRRERQSCLLSALEYSPVSVLEEQSN